MKSFYAKKVMKNIFYILLLMPMLLWSNPFHIQKQIKEISASVVKIYSTSAKADYDRPWQKQDSTASSGTGVIIDNHLIITAAHVVSDSTYLQVKKAMIPKKKCLKNGKLPICQDYPTQSLQVKMSMMFRKMD